PGAGLLPRRDRALRRCTRTQGAAHGLEPVARPQTGAAAGRTAAGGVGVLRPLLLRGAARRRLDRGRDGLSDTVHVGHLARQPVRHAIPPREEPARRSGDAAPLRPMALNTEELTTESQRAQRKTQKIKNRKTIGLLREDSSIFISSFSVFFSM